MTNLPPANPTARAAYDAALRIDLDLRCVACGYALTGLRADGLCPECGEVIERSLRSRQLRNADSRWTRKLKLGVDLFLVSFVARLLITILTGVVMQISSGLVSWAAYAFQLFGQVVGPLLLAAGVFLLTTPEPNDPAPLRRLPLVMRIAALTILTMRALTVSALFFQPQLQSAPFQFIEAVAFGAVLFGVFRLVSILAWRAVLPNISAQADALRWSLAILVGLGIAGALILSSGAFAGLGVAWLVGLALLGGLFASVVFAIWGFFLLVVFRVKLANHLVSVW